MSQINSKWCRIQKWLLLTRLILYEPTCSWKTPEWQFSLGISWNTNWTQCTSGLAECTKTEFWHRWINCTHIKKFFPTLSQSNTAPILVLLTLITYIVLLWCKTLLLSFHYFIHTHKYTHTHWLQTPLFRCSSVKKFWVCYCSGDRKFWALWSPRL